MKTCLPPEQAAATLLTLLQGLGSLDAMEGYFKMLLYFSSLEVEGDWAWLLL